MSLKCLAALLYVRILLEENVLKNLVNHVKTFNNENKSLKFYHILHVA